MLVGGRLGGRALALPARNRAHGTEDSWGCRMRPQGNGGMPQRVPSPTWKYEEARGGEKAAR